ncbi:MAG: leucine-rich repeat domain-containing protein [Treponema sp.]|nr:leucine-rich repeat domain-containing protein [Treponema sp.]
MTLFCLGRLYAQTEMDFMINGNGTITKYTGRKNVEAVIPAIIDGKPVIGIGKEAFAGNNLISVTIPGTVETIGESAFSGYKLTSIIIPNSVTAIGNSAFAENNLASVVIHGAAVIESSAFSHDNTIKSVTFGKNLLLRVCL